MRRALHHGCLGGWRGKPARSCPARTREVGPRGGGAAQPRRNGNSGRRKTISKGVYVPLCVGGGLRTLEDIHEVLRAGADKVSCTRESDRISCGIRCRIGPCRMGYPSLLRAAALGSTRSNRMCAVQFGAGGCRSRSTQRRLRIARSSPRQRAASDRSASSARSKPFGRRYRVP